MSAQVQKRSGRPERISPRPGDESEIRPSRAKPSKESVPPNWPEEFPERIVPRQAHQPQIEVPIEAYEPQSKETYELTQSLERSIPIEIERPQQSPSRGDYSKQMSQGNCKHHVIKIFKDQAFYNFLIVFFKFKYQI